MKKEGFVLYEVFLILVFMVMAGESFSYILNHKPTTKQYLDEKLLFLDPTVDVFLAIVYPLMTVFFIILGCLMIKRLKNFHKRYRSLTKSIIQAMVALSAAQIAVGLRYVIEVAFRTQLKDAADELIVGGSRTDFFVFYWFCSIALTEYACYLALIFAIWLRKKKDWDRLLRLPLKLPKAQ